MSVLLFAIVFVIVYSIYHLTLFPSISGGDSGELLAESCHLGVAHPPGYPIFTLLGYAIEKIAFPRFYISELGLSYTYDTSVAWKVNHLCCVFGSITAALIGLSCFKLLRRRSLYSFSSSIICAVLFAFSPLVWEYSIQAEVFALNNMLCSVIVYLVICVNEELNSKELSTIKIKFLVLCGSFMCGMALCNQHSSLLLVTCVVPYILLITNKQHMNILYIFMIAMCFTIGISGYYYLFFAALFPKKGSWGNTSNMYGLMRHILRSEYGTLQLGLLQGHENMIERILLYFQHINHESIYFTTFPFVIVGVLSLYYEPSVRERRKQEQLTLQAKSKSDTNKLKSSNKNVIKINAKNRNKQNSLIGTIDSSVEKIGASNIVDSNSIELNKELSSSTDGTTINPDREKCEVNISKKDDINSLESVNEKSVKVKITKNKNRSKTASDTQQPTEVVSSNSAPTKSMAKTKEVAPISKIPDISNVSSYSIDTADKSKGDVTSIAINSSSCTTSALSLREDMHSFATDTSVVTCLLLCWIFYLIAWNGILSNLPLSAPMPYAVHSRFWMQPNIILYIFAGCGMSFVLTILHVIADKYFVKPLFFESKHEDASNNIIFNTIFETIQRKLNEKPCVLSIETSARVLVNNVIIYVVLWHIITERYQVMDKSRDGWIMNAYGDYILKTVAINPRESLLLSHTDLNWNSIRYIQECEKSTSHSQFSIEMKSVYFADVITSAAAYKSIVHLNFQLMPYPWFAARQAPLYPSIKFPPLFQGVTTQRSTQENALLIQRFLSANFGNVTDDFLSSIDTPWGTSRPIFLDMQSVNDQDIRDGGRWRNFTLVPWGMVYLVTKSDLTLHESLRLHMGSMKQLHNLRKSFPIFSSRVSPSIFSIKYPSGSWEYGVASTYHDAHNQLGLNLLSFAIEMQKNIKTLSDLSIVIDRYIAAYDILSYTIESIKFLSSRPSRILETPAHLGTSLNTVLYAISSEYKDLLKNTALCIIRLEPVISLALQYRTKFITEIESNATIQQYFIKDDFAYEITSDEYVREIRVSALQRVSEFITASPNDKDIETFQNAAHTIKNKL